MDVATPPQQRYGHEDPGSDTVPIDHRRSQEPSNSKRDTCSHIYFHPCAPLHHFHCHLVLQGKPLKGSAGSSTVPLSEHIESSHVPSQTELFSSHMPHQSCENCFDLPLKPSFACFSSPRHLMEPEEPSVEPSRLFDFFAGLRLSSTEGLRFAAQLLVRVVTALRRNFWQTVFRFTAGISELRTRSLPDIKWQNIKLGKKREVSLHSKTANAT